MHNSQVIWFPLNKTCDFTNVCLVPTCFVWQVKSTSQDHPTPNSRLYCSLFFSFPFILNFSQAPLSSLKLRPSLVALPCGSDLFICTVSSMFTSGPIHVQLIFKIYNFVIQFSFSKILFTFMWVSLYLWVGGGACEARVQPTGVSFLFPPRGSNSGCQAWWKATFILWAVSQSHLELSCQSRHPRWAYYSSTVKCLQISSHSCPKPKSNTGHFLLSNWCFG